LIINTLRIYQQTLSNENAKIYEIFEIMHGRIKRDLEGTFAEIRFDFFNLFYTFVRPFSIDFK